MSSEKSALIDLSLLTAATSVNGSSSFNGKPSTVGASLEVDEDQKQILEH